MGRNVAIIGAGYVADLYMRSFRTFPDVRICCVYDRRPERSARFGAHWSVRVAQSLEDIFDAKPDLILNLTNPGEHYAVSRSCLEHGFPVYSEKPLATDMEDALALHGLAQSKGLVLASAPCSLLGESGQAVVRAVRERRMGIPRLVYAELDDDFIPQSPYKSWISESGAPWPYDDEFQVGCTLEHAGYYLTWLIGAFGAVERVVAASADLLPSKEVTGKSAPDFSVGVLFFRSGVVARITCSIIARHAHGLRIVGDEGQLEVNECWDNSAPVRVRKRLTLRRRLLYHPFPSRIKFAGNTHPKVKRSGSAEMNFALGPVDVLEAIESGREPRLGGNFALHMNEVTLALQNAGCDKPLSIMRTSCDPPELMPWNRGP